MKPRIVSLTLCLVILLAASFSTFCNLIDEGRRGVGLETIQALAMESVWTYPDTGATVQVEATVIQAACGSFHWIEEIIVTNVDADPAPPPSDSRFSVSSSVLPDRRLSDASLECSYVSNGSNGSSAGVFVLATVTETLNGDFMEFIEGSTPENRNLSVPFIYDGGNRGSSGYISFPEECEPTGEAINTKLPALGAVELDDVQRRVRGLGKLEDLQDRWIEH